MCTISCRVLIRCQLGTREPWRIARIKAIVKVRQRRKSQSLAKMSTFDDTMLLLIMRGLNFQLAFSPKLIFLPSLDLKRPDASLKMISRLSKKSTLI